MCVLHLLFILLIFPTHSPDPRRSSSADSHSHLIGDRRNSSHKYRLSEVTTSDRRETTETRSSRWKTVRLLNNRLRKSWYDSPQFKEQEGGHMKRAVQQSLLEADKMEGRRAEENRLMNKALKQSKEDYQKSRLREIGRPNLAQTSNRLNPWDPNWKGPWHFFEQGDYILFKLKQFSRMKEKALFFRRVFLLGKKVSQGELAEEEFRKSVKRQQKQANRQSVPSKQALQDDIRISLQMNRWRKQGDYDLDLERVLLRYLEAQGVGKVEQIGLEDIGIDFWLQAEKECLQSRCAKWSGEIRIEQVYAHFRRLMRLKVMGVIDHSLDHLEREEQLTKRWNRDAFQERHGQFLRLMQLLELRVINDFKWPYADLQIMSARSDSERQLRMHHDQLLIQIQKSSFDARRRLQQLARDTHIKLAEINRNYQSQMNQIQVQNLLSRFRKLRSVADQTSDYTTATRQELLNRKVELEQMKEREQTKKSLQSQIVSMLPLKPLRKQSKRQTERKSEGKSKRKSEGKTERKSERQTLKQTPYSQTKDKHEFSSEEKRMGEQRLSEIRTAKRVSEDKDNPRLAPLDAPLRLRPSLEQIYRVSPPASRLPIPSTGLMDKESDELIVIGTQRRSQSEKQEEVKEVQTFDRSSAKKKKNSYREALLRFNEDNIVQIALPKTPNDLFEEQEEDEPELFPVDLSDEAHSAH